MRKTKPRLLVLLGLASGLLACPPEQQSRAEPATSSPPRETSAATPAIATTTAGEASPAPQIAFAQTEIDVGTVAQGDLIEQQFIVKNRGLGELNIEKVAGS